MSQIQEIKDQLSLVEIVGERVALTAAGNYYRGLCPFHHEKSPSFFVNDTLGFYKCYGCGEHGDIFDFVQKYDSLSFKEALEILAARAGITLEKQRFDPKDELRAQILGVLQISSEYFENNLRQSPAAAATRSYLQSRGVTSSSQNLFHLGAALEGWQNLSDYLQQKKLPLPAIIGSGLVGQNKTGRLFDRFRNRLMFPLKNHRGQVVGFSGRIMTDTKDEAKYLNTPETLVYHKGKMLYGLHELGQEIKKAGALIVVEGEFDLLSSVQAKVNNIAAIKGSAFTSDQATLVARYVKKVILALDGDKAGINATKKAIAVLRPVGVEVEVLALPQGQDPDELARANAASWREQTKRTLSVYDFFLQVTLGQHNLKQISEQKKVLQELADVFALIDNRLEYEHYLKKLATALGQEPEIIRQDLLSWRQLHVSQATPVPKISSKSEPPKKLSKLERLEAYLWFLFLQCLSQKTNLAPASAYLRQVKWQNPFLQQLTQAYFGYAKTKKEPTLKSFHQSLAADFQEKVALLGLNRTFINYLSKTDLGSEWAYTVHEHAGLSRKKQIADLSQQLASLEELSGLTPEQEGQRSELLEQITTLAHVSSPPAQGSNVN